VILLLLVGAVVGLGVGMPAATTGPVQTTQVNVPKPSSSERGWGVELDPGAAAITVGTGGAGLIEGTIAYNVADLKPAITTRAAQVLIKAGDLSNKIVTGGPVQDNWNLQLGQGVPLRLTVHAGATQGTYELGGLSLETLTWTQGASAATVHFSRPNPIKLTTFDVTAGASDLTMTGLANTNLGTATFKLGAGNLTLAFDGALAQDAIITVEGGASHLTLVSGGNPVQVETNAGRPSGVTPGTWTQAGATFSSPEWATATGPRVMIHTNLGAGSVTLLTSK
jgi:hypothetical protein